MTEPRIMRHIIGRTHKRHVAILAAEFLRDRMCEPHSVMTRDQIVYEEQTTLTGETREFQIILADGMTQEFYDRAVDVCRAFVAGAGDCWA